MSSSGGYYHPPRRPLTDTEREEHNRRRLRTLGYWTGGTVLAGLILAGLYAALFLGESTAVDQRGLHYSGGPFEDKDFVGYIPAGTGYYLRGPGDDVYRYPITDRTWHAKKKLAGSGSLAPGADRGPITFASKDGVRMTVEAETFFTLNQADGPFRQFHERIGLKTEAWTDEGWREWLTTYVDPPLERAIDAVGLRYDHEPLWTSEETRVAFQTAVAEQFQRNLSDTVKGDYLCGPDQVAGESCPPVSFTVGKPEPPGKIIDAIEAEQEAEALATAQIAKNERITNELQATREEVDAYGQEGYACITAAELAAQAGVRPPTCVFSGGAAVAVSE